MSYTSDTLVKIQNQLKKDFADKVSEEKIERGTKKLMERFETNVKKGFDKLEIYILKSILRLPDDVLLPEDAAHEKHPEAKEELEQIDADILELKKRLINVRFFQSIPLKEYRATSSCLYCTSTNI